MSQKLSNNSEIHKILVISLTNIGDVVLTFPVIDILKKDFPSAKLSVVIGPKATSLIVDNPYITGVHIFDKRQSPLKSLSWICELRREHYDMVVDLRNTAIPVMIAARYRTSYRNKRVINLHMREKHLDRLKTVYAFERKTAEPCSLFIPAREEDYIDELIQKEIGSDKSFVIIAPGAADSSKVWPEEKFAFVCDHLIKKHNVNVCFIGNDEDRRCAQRINKIMEADGVNLCGRTNLVQLAELFNRCFFTIVNDSAPMHIASYVNTPILALFGPTNPDLYGPWSEKSCYLRKSESCSVCSNPKQNSKHSCMDAITVDDVLRMLKMNII